MQESYDQLRQRWDAGERDRELALQLMFFAWMNWADPPNVTGMVYDPDAHRLWREGFNYFGGEDSSDAEFLFAAGIMTAVTDWMDGEAHAEEWAERSKQLKRRSAQIQPSGLPDGVFADRGEYGKYFDHHLRRAASRGS